ncbi:hypothetical protein [Dickeya dianthicola]|uniref:hypothetical protein n=1 Tax=Dickeya dianthicola TaxID=204039 RepID=UPI003016B5D2
MSDEISILTHISEENPTAASPYSVTETGFVADSQRPHAISDRASVAFIGWHNSAHAALQHDFANAKTAFTTVTTTALFFCFIAACALLSWHGFSAFVNGGNDFNAEFGKSNSGYILRWFPKADDHDDKRALS